MWRGERQIKSKTEEGWKGGGEGVASERNRQRTKERKDDGEREKNRAGGREKEG